MKAALGSQLLYLDRDYDLSSLFIDSFYALALQHKPWSTIQVPEDLTGELFRPQKFNEGADTSGFAQRRAKMAWKAPKVVEVPCGMEINMYVSATRK